MVHLTAVEEQNAQFSAKRCSQRVAVFVGATHGIGAGTLETMAELLVEPTLYVVGRSEARFAPQRARLQQVNPGAKVVFVLADISSISGVDEACAMIKAAESRVDYLCMSPGYLPLNGPQYTKEGLEVCFVLSYYARLRFVSNLLPLLDQSSQPRVLSVLCGGKEAKLREDDLGLTKCWTTFNLVYQATTMNTLAFFHLAKQHERITFVHAAPGQVRTASGRSKQPPAPTYLWAIAVLIFRSLFAILQFFTSISVEDSGKRHAYNLTSDRFGPGVWRVDERCDTCAESAVVEDYRNTGWTERVWEFTEGVWKSVL